MKRLRKRRAGRVQVPPEGPGATQTKTELIEYGFGPGEWRAAARHGGNNGRGLLLKDLLSFLFGSLQKSKQLHVLSLARLLLLPLPSSELESKKDLDNRFAVSRLAERAHPRSCVDPQ